ncbi:MAG: GNAT family N-acetyltransferase [Kouleothrix sp.]|nr:GNAT family N-acetyltransferase [Kouleothrix sp.]
MFGSLKFKFATEDWEFEQIHHLNYTTFVEEIPQHGANPDRALVDKFHRENTYIIALDHDRLVGMIAVRGARPFSLDTKLENLDSYLPAGRRLCELRLLAVEKKYRNGWVFWGMGKLLTEHCLQRGYDLALISGTTRQQRLYRHLGFLPFGPLVGPAGAEFQPMYLSLETFRRRARMFRRAMGREDVAPELQELMQEADEAEVAPEEN